MMFWMLSTFISWLEESIFLNMHPLHTKTSQKRRKITAQFQTSASEGNVVLTCTFPIKTIAVSLAKFLCIRWNLNFPRPQTSCFPYRNFLMTRNNSKPLSLRFILNEIHFYTHAYYQNLFAEASFTWHLKFLCECIILFSTVVKPLLPFSGVSTLCTPAKPRGSYSSPVGCTLLGAWAGIELEQIPAHSEPSRSKNSLPTFTIPCKITALT